MWFWAISFFFFFKFVNKGKNVAEDKMVNSSSLRETKDVYCSKGNELFDPRLEKGNSFVDHLWPTFQTDVWVYCINGPRVRRTVLCLFGLAARDDAISHSFLSACRKPFHHGCVTTFTCIVNDRVAYQYYIINWDKWVQVYIYIWTGDSPFLVFNSKTRGAGGTNSITSISISIRASRLLCLCNFPLPWWRKIQARLQKQQPPPPPQAWRE